MHVVEHGIGKTVINGGNGSGARTELRHPVDRATIVSAIRARLNDDDPFDVKRTVQRAHVIGRGWLVPVPVRSRVREARRIAEYVRVGITRPRQEL